MTVISFDNLRFDFAFRSGGYDVHLPKDVLQELLFAIVHCCNFLGIILIRIRFNSVNRKNLLPYSTTSTHFKHIIGYCVLFSLQLGIIICVDFGAILKKWTAKSERWYNNKKRRERHGKHQVYRGIQAKHSKLV